MKPPRDLIEKFLAEGEIGVWSSVLLLGAALAIKQGRDPRIEGVHALDGGEDIPAGAVALLRQAADVGIEGLRRATPDELDHAIALYRAHLEAAGYQVEAGYEH